MLLVLTGLSLCWNVDGLLAPSSARVSSVRLAASSKYYKSNGEQIKAPLSGYMHFCAEERDKVTKLLKDQHGETFQTKMVMVELGQRWKREFSFRSRLVS